jgi:predicted secreted protein
MSNVARSIDTVIRLNGVALGGQQGANLIRQTEAIDITNRIHGEWAESLAGKKSWNIVCSGLYITNDKAFVLLEDAFMNNKTVEVLISFGGSKMKGNAIITDFPLNSVFNKEFKYNIKLLGTGALVPEV